MAGNIAIFVPHSGCPQLCSFCNQRTISGKQTAPTGDDAATTCRTALASLPPRVDRVEIAFFGGSFTAVPRDYMLELLDSVQPFLANERISGIRISTRPDAIDTEILEILKAHGVTAIELGAQSMDNRVLAMNERGHTADDVISASRLIRSYGFSLGLQMMTGLFGSNASSDYATAEAIAALAPDTVRIYPTVVLQGTMLAARLADGSYSPPDVAATVPLCARIVELMEEHKIKVIRLGLHASESMESEILGGCYHPALGELVAGERYYNRLSAEMLELGGTDFILRIRPRLLSQVQGQHKNNLKRLGQNGYKITCIADDGLTDIAYRLEKRGEG